MNHASPEPAHDDHNDSASAGVLDQDVGCPGCGYNLRGLGGGLVHCPECGLKSDVSDLLLRRWDKPWYRAPKYNLICMPAGVVLIGPIVGLMLLIVSQAFGGDSSAFLGGLWLLACFGAWMGAMAYVWRNMGGWVSAGFALLAHTMIVGYLGSLILVLIGLSLAIVWLVDLVEPGLDGPGLGGVLIGLGMLAGGIGIFVLTRWAERLVAGHCIRLYLRRPTTSG